MKTNGNTLATLAIACTLITGVAPSLHADPISVPGNVVIVSAPGPYVDGFITSPYQIIFNGQLLTAFCDDFEDTVSIGQSWEVNEYQGDGLIYPKFSASVYETEYYLVENETPANEIPTELAMWAETDPGFPYGTAASVEMLNEAIANSASVVPSDFEVLTPTGTYGQEFIVEKPSAVVSPEPPPFLLVGFGMFGIGLWKRKA